MKICIALTLVVIVALISSFFVEATSGVGRHRPGVLTIDTGSVMEGSKADLCVVANKTIDDQPLDGFLLTRYAGKTIIEDAYSRGFGTKSVSIFGINIWRDGG